MRAFSVISVAFGLLLPACKHEQTGPIPVCLNEVAGNEAEEVKSQDIPAHVWFSVILKNYNSRTKELQRPTRDCSGRTLETDQEVAICVAAESDPVPLPARPLDEEEDILVVPGDEAGQAIVWIRTDHLEGDYAMGPVALAEWTRRGVAVRAIGPLYANTNKVRMRLEKMDAGKVLVVESNVCDPEKPKDCTRVMRLLPLVGYRFEERPLIDKDTEECLGPATFELRKHKEVQLDTGILRDFELTRSFDFAEGRVMLTEQVTIKDSDPKAPDAPPSVFRSSHVERPMTLVDKGVATGVGLWERMLSEHGSVSLKAGKPEGEGEGEGEGSAEGGAPPAGGS
jgi:hypothetical protein